MCSLISHISNGVVWAMAQEIADQRPVLPHMLRARAVGDPRRLHDGPIVAHIVDDPDEAVIEHVEALVEHLLERRPPVARLVSCEAARWASISARLWSSIGMARIIPR